MSDAEYMREYMHAYYHAKMERAKALLGNKCTHALCDITEDLQFDHIDPAAKLFLITDGWKKPEEVFLAELKKCQLLCKKHHEEKTAAELSVPHGGGKAGKTIRLNGKRVKCPCAPCTEQRRSYNQAYREQQRRAQLTVQDLAS